jgi:hypothetical protein
MREPHERDMKQLYILTLLTWLTTLPSASDGTERQRRQQYEPRICIFFIESLGNEHRKTVASCLVVGMSDKELPKPPPQKYFTHGTIIAGKPAFPAMPPIGGILNVLTLRLLCEFSKGAMWEREPLKDVVLCWINTYRKEKMR